MLNAVAILIYLAIVTAALGTTMNETEETDMKYNKLTPEEEEVIVRKGTESPFSGEYCQHKEAGTYHCKRCDAPLFRSEHKFESACGWPSFDNAIPDAVREQPDPDGARTEITCAACGGHLGHVFLGEGFTDQNVRHCVNSISMKFVPLPHDETVVSKTYFAGGCFWGMEYFFQKAEGVISVRSGYMGGTTDNPNYDDVCSGTSGHAEAIEVAFDPSVTSFEKLAKLFFEIHDPTQVDRQGPDVGEQYRSVVFFVDDEQKQTAEMLIRILEGKGYNVATKLQPADRFWPAEEYHQNYYNRTGKLPYCHIYQKRF